MCEPLLAGPDAARCARPAARAVAPPVDVDERAGVRQARVRRAGRGPRGGRPRRPRRRSTTCVLPADPLVVVIEGVEKPGNLGAILRSADGAGADAVIAAGAADGPVQPERDPGERSGRSSACPSRPRRRPRSLAWLARSGIRIVAARVDAAPRSTDADLPGPVAIVLGSEAEGLDRRWRGADVEAGPPADAGVADSLNVSAAAAVLSTRPGANATARRTARH